MEGPRPPGLILLLITVVTFKLYAKMLKETKTEETIVFFVTFLSLVAFQLGGPGPPGYAYAGGRAPHLSLLKLLFWNITQ